MRPIDADALLNDSSIVYHTEYGVPVVDVEDIKKAPTVELPHVKWGKWIINEVRCPECLEYFYTDCYAKGELDKCPHCGADMRRKEGEANEDD